MGESRYSLTHSSAKIGIKGFLEDCHHCNFNSIVHVNGACRVHLPRKRQHYCVGGYKGADHGGTARVIIVIAGGAVKISPDTGIAILVEWVTPFGHVLSTGGADHGAAAEFIIVIAGGQARVIIVIAGGAVDTGIAILVEWVTPFAPSIFFRRTTHRTPPPGGRVRRGRGRGRQRRVHRRGRQQRRPGAAFFGPHAILPHTVLHNAAGADAHSSGGRGRRHCHLAPQMTGRERTERRCAS